MKLSYLATAAAAFALAGGVAYAQDTAMPEPPAPASDTTAPAPASDNMAVNPAAPSSASTTEAPTTVESPPAAPAAAVDTSAATFTNMTVTNGPVPDTPENRAKYGSPLSNAGKHTAAKGN